MRTEIDEIPGRLEVDAYREEVVVEHEAVGEVVSQRDNPWEENGVLIIPIDEEQLVVTKRLVLRERMRVRRVGTTQRQLFQDSLRRERLVVDDPQHTGLVREQYPPGGAYPSACSLAAAVVIGYLHPVDRSELAPGYPAGLDTETHRATLAAVAARVHGAQIAAPIARTVT